MTNYIAPRSKLFAHLDKLQAIKDYAAHPVGQRPAPLNIELDASWRCSHGCDFCHFAYTHTRGPLKGKQDKPHDAIDGGDLLDFDLAKDILRQVAEYGVKSVVWSGGGEPTLNPHFNELVRHAASVRLEQGLYTHGGHIDDERAALLKNTLTWVFVSLDACTAESFKATKGVNRFDAVIGGIKRLIYADGDATVGVGFMIHEGNWRDIHGMVQLGRDLGVDYVQFRPVVDYDHNAPSKSVDGDAAWIRHAIGRLQAYKHDSFVIADVARFDEYAKWQGHGYSTCHWSALQVVISPNGKMWRCTNKREYPDALLGDLTQESFAEAWNRSGGACQVNERCRIFCRGHLANQQLTPMMATDVPHANFV